MGRLAVVLALGATAVVVTNAIARLRLQLVAQYNGLRADTHELIAEVRGIADLAMVNEANKIVDKWNKEEVLGA